ncbi:MAG: lysine biosynthesis protein LysW [Nitrososphaerota archaeon]|nr:lysine biosynthesis protein LysW [Nitrososphaerota archaeon]MDG6939049.1 lysine biosynthesis protein LysW [Nitrososphaerota archaeon]
MECEQCGGQVQVPKDVIAGEIVGCKDCGSEYEVVIGAQGTIELKSAEQVGEDWGE